MDYLYRCLPLELLVDVCWNFCCFVISVLWDFLICKVNLYLYLTLLGAISTLSFLKIWEFSKKMQYDWPMSYDIRYIKLCISKLWVFSFLAFSAFLATFLRKFMTFTLRFRVYYCLEAWPILLIAPFANFPRLQGRK